MKKRGILGSAYLDLKLAKWLLLGTFGGLKVNSDRGSCISIVGWGCLVSALGGLTGGPAITPTPDSTRTCPLEPVLEPSKGISFRVEKFRGLRPRTTMGAVVDSAKQTFELLLSVAIAFR